MRQCVLPSSLALVIAVSGCDGGGGSASAPADLPTLTVTNASVVEGSGGGTTNLVFTVTLSAASTGAVTVDYATVDGTALSARDYTATAATLTIAAGATSGTITVLVGADTITEPNETLTLTLSNPTGATIATAAATGTITNDDWIYNSAAGTAMINAGFVYVPGGWDVNGDGVVESGFWISKYQAAATATAATIKPNLIDYLAGTAAKAYADGMQMYNPATKQFDQTLCTDGSDVAPGSWTNGVVNAGGTLWRGNSNSGSALAANNAGATDTTENATFDVNRRTWLLTNGVMANDSNVPATYCKATNADASANGSRESVNAATESKCTIWDMAGNVWQWTRGLIAANATTSSTGVRAGGDRFINGASSWQEYSNVTLQTNAPAWWLPSLSGGGVTLTSTQNVGQYFDGNTQAGTFDSFDLGYGLFNVSGFAAVVRGGYWFDGARAGLAAADLLSGPGARGFGVGFRAAVL